MADAENALVLAYGASAIIALWCGVVQPFVCAPAVAGDPLHG
eukprot:CAMPEP_0119411456 /NCGR_PEP_ID=MMETSP1335-20130426/4201_1 /TAXON_ID=259385 /ORGANISM="Chrysoculter rhomboideus, Strain RCC1486" /LENGTH=41 /DNA_ID= /DNA_START= /DNA_END= /DNA_ORIENTATION=